MGERRSRVGPFPVLGRRPREMRKRPTAVLRLSPAFTRRRTQTTRTRDLNALLFSGSFCFLYKNRHRRVAPTSDVVTALAENQSSLKRFLEIVNSCRLAEMNTKLCHEEHCQNNRLYLVW